MTDLTPEPADTSVGVGVRVSDKLGLEVPEKRARGGCSVWFTSDLYSTSRNRWGRNTEAKRKKKKKDKGISTHEERNRRRQWHPTPVLLPGKSHGWRSLVGSSPWGRLEPGTTERLHFHFSLSCIGEGNGNPLQCSCLENPRDGGAWWAALYGVAQSQTRLGRLSSSSRRKE